MMRTLVNVAGSVIVMAFCAVASYWLCYRPYRCNRISRAVGEQTLAAWEAAERLAPNWQIIIDTRRRLEVLRPCLGRCTGNVQMHMVAAANLRLLKRYEEAAGHYRKALRYDHRPEIYFNLGLTEIDAGRREEGIRNLVLAGRTGAYWNLIADESVRNEVTRRLFYEPPPRF
jgi:tetratricopeptide (TPR) repeat protein